MSIRAVHGVFDAHRAGDDIVLDSEGVKLHGLRQQECRVGDQTRMCLSDCVASKGDYVGAFVTSVFGAQDLAKKAEEDGDDYRRIMLLSVADRLAEAAAEAVHRHMRTSSWGFSTGLESALDSADLFKCKYNGIRPAPGYPSQVRLC